MVRLLTLLALLLAPVVALAQGTFVTPAVSPWTVITSPGVNTPVTETTSPLAVTIGTSPFATTLGSPIPGVSVAQTTAITSAIIAKASAGNLVSVSGSGFANQYIMLFNLTTIPTSGAVTPTKCFGPLQANGPYDFAWGSGPTLTMSAGIIVAISSVGCFTLSMSNTAFISVEFQ
jgi:hypothetical protein